MSGVRGSRGMDARSDAGGPRLGARPRAGPAEDLLPVPGPRVKSVFVWNVLAKEFVPCSSEAEKQLVSDKLVPMVEIQNKQDIQTKYENGATKGAQR